MLFFFVLIGIISAIIYWFCLKPEVSDVLEQNGYQMIAQTEESMEITIHKKDLPEECFTSEGYEFKENEFLLYQDGINTIYLEKVMYDDDAWEYLYFGIAFSYNIPAYGTVIVPYKINVKSDEVSDYRMSGKLASKDVQDKTHRKTTWRTSETDWLASRYKTNKYIAPIKARQRHLQNCAPD